MSTTIVPPYNGPIEPFDVEEFRTFIRTMLVDSQGNCDKASETDDNAYYQGQVDVLEGVLAYLLGARDFGTPHPFISDGGTPGHCVWCGEIFDHDNHEGANPPPIRLGK